MIGEWIRFGLAALCVLAGCFALLTAIVGLFRFDFSLNRLHAAHHTAYLSFIGRRGYICPGHQRFHPGDSLIIQL